MVLGSLSSVAGNSSGSKICAFPERLTTPPIAMSQTALRLARVAKEFGAGSPILLAKQYNLFPQFFASTPTGLELLQADYAMLARLIEAENKAHEARNKRRQDAYEHPGMERYDSLDDFWAEAEAAGRGDD